MTTPNSESASVPEPAPEAAPAQPPVGKPTWKRRILREIPWLLAMAAIVWYVRGDQAPRLAVGQPTVRFEAPLLSGGTLKSGQWGDVPQVLIFWAPWCTVCATEFPLLDELQATMGNRARVIGVGLSGSEEEMRRFAADHPVDFPLVRGGEDVERQFGVRAFPTVFVLDSKGIVLDRLVGLTTTWRIRWALRDADGNAAPVPDSPHSVDPSSLK